MWWTVNDVRRACKSGDRGALLEMLDPPRSSEEPQTPEEKYHASHEGDGEATASRQNRLAQWASDHSLVNVVDPMTRSTLLHVAVKAAGFDNMLYDLLSFLVLDCGVSTEIPNAMGATPLCKAAQQGDLEAVRLLFEVCGASVMTTTKNGSTPVLLALKSGHLNVVDYLVKVCEADVSSPSDDGETPLQQLVIRGDFDRVKTFVREHKADTASTSGHLRGNRLSALHQACRDGRLDIAKFLVEEGTASVNLKTARGFTPLHIACSAMDVDMMEYLVNEAHADVNVQDNGGFAPVHLSTDREHLGGIEVLVAGGANPDLASHEGLTSLHVAAEKGNVGLVKALVEQYGVAVNPVNVDGHTPLYDACSYGLVDVAMHLIEMGADVRRATADGWTPIYTACKSGVLELVRLLAAHGADASQPNAVSNTPMTTSCFQGRLDMVKFLAEDCQAPVDAPGEDGDGPIHNAAFRGEVEIVQYLVLTHGVDPNTQSDSGRTPLSYAAEQGHSLVVEFLVNEAGAAIDLADAEGNTPLHHVAQAGTYVIPPLLFTPTGTYTQNHQGKTPLHLACQYQHLHLVSTMHLTAPGKLAIEVVDRDGNTPLHAACQSGLLGIVKILFSAASWRKDKTVLRDAVLQMRNADGWTPRDIAQQNGHADIILFLDELSDHHESASGSGATNLTPPIPTEVHKSTKQPVTDKPAPPSVPESPNAYHCTLCVQEPTDAQRREWKLTESLQSTPGWVEILCDPVKAQRWRDELRARAATPVALACGITPALVDSVFDRVAADAERVDASNPYSPRPAGVARLYTAELSPSITEALCCTVERLKGSPESDNSKRVVTIVDPFEYCHVPTVTQVAESVLADPGPIMINTDSLQWLPSVFSVSHSGQVTIESPLPGLYDRGEFDDLYRGLGSLFEAALPLFEVVYAELLDLTERPVKAAETAAPPTSASEGHTDSNGDEVTHPARPRSLRGRDLRVVTSLTRTTLEPGSASPPDDWGVAGGPCDAVVASATCVLASSNLSVMRQHIRPMIKPSSFDQGGRIVDGGCVAIRPGSVAVRPNVVQVLRSPQHLVDPTRPGWLVMAEFHLVDPELAVLSTRETCLQRPQCVVALLADCDRFAHIPIELIEHIVTFVPNLYTPGSAEAAMYKRSLLHEHRMSDESLHNKFSTLRFADIEF
eukprot:m.316214 g.316214  ORF g.316214 m.316214 type:complete len:1171 (+) comp16421_c1_seq1:438-3950(+)